MDWYCLCLIGSNRIWNRVCPLLELLNLELENRCNFLVINLSLSFVRLYYMFWFLPTVYVYMLSSCCDDGHRYQTHTIFPKTDVHASDTVNLLLKAVSHVVNVILIFSHNTHSAKTIWITRICNNIPPATDNPLQLCWWAVKTTWIYQDIVHWVPASVRYNFCLCFPAKTRRRGISQLSELIST